MVPDRLGAVGFRLPNQDPEAIARGNAFAATADNPSAIYYNPAGITQLEGDNIRVGIYVISADTKFTSPSGATAQTDTSLQAVPQIYYVHSFTNVPISVGLGVYVPYGLSLDWGNNSPFNTVAESGSLMYLCFNPVIAWRVIRTLFQSPSAQPLIIRRRILRGPLVSFLAINSNLTVMIPALVILQESYGSHIRCGHLASITTRQRHWIIRAQRQRPPARPIRRQLHPARQSTFRNLSSRAYRSGRRPTGISSLIWIGPNGVS